MTRSSSPLGRFNKPWISSADQVAILTARGLQVPDSKAAEAFLSHINYYRFCGYCLAFEQARHIFHPNVTFEHIRAAYDFDWKLRDLLSDALEVVEIDLRANVAHHFGQAYGPFGHCSPANFFERFAHSDWIESLRTEADRSSELFVTHFRQTYADFPDLPIWMATEVMSFGCLSKMIAGLLKPDQKALARRYNLQPRDLAHWTHHLVYVRNLCAHHSRLWDGVWAIKPSLPAAFAWNPPRLPGNNRLFVTLLILSFLLKRCPTMSQFRADWRQRIESHLQSPPAAPNAMGLMGLTPAWLAHPFWA